MKTYNLALHRNYVSSWGLSEAFRELMQNALDNPEGFSFEVSEGEPISITLTSFKSEIPIQALLLGYSTKAQDATTIGQFGEGLKLALLVLAREGFSVSIQTRNIIWYPGFEFSANFSEETFIIQEHDFLETYENTVISISGLDNSNLETIKNTCLHLIDKESLGEVYKTSMGDIYLELPGKLYVGGLFVCDTGHTYSYDIKPEYLQLDRDRQTVDSWDLGQVTARMWEKVLVKTKLAEGIASGASDFNYFNYYQPTSVIEACVEHFQKEEGKAALPVDSNEDFTFLSSKQNVKPVFIKEPVYASLLKAASGFLKKLTTLKSKPSPGKQLSKFLKENESLMSEELKKNFRKLIRRAKTEDWNN